MDIIVPLEIIFGTDNVKFVYINIDKQDWNCINKETYTYNRNDDIELNINLESNVISVTGIAEFEAEYIDEEKKYTNNGVQQINHTFQITLTDEDDLNNVADKLEKILLQPVHQN